MAYKTGLCYTAQPVNRKGLIIVVEKDNPKHVNFMIYSRLKVPPVPVLIKLSLIRTLVPYQRQPSRWAKKVSLFIVAITSATANQPS